MPLFQFTGEAPEPCKCHGLRFRDLVSGHHRFALAHPGDPDVIAWSQFCDKQEQQDSAVKYIPREGGVSRHYIDVWDIEPNSSCDVRIGGGQYIGLVGESKPAVEVRIELTLSWLALKSLAQLAQQRIEEFERYNGEIKPPVMAEQKTPEPISISVH